MALVCMGVIPVSAALSGVHTAPCAARGQLLSARGAASCPPGTGCRPSGTASSQRCLGTGVGLNLVYLGQSADGNLKCQCNTGLRKVRKQALSAL